MRKRFLKAVLLVFMALVIAVTAAPVFAAHPLITDDTGTQGTGKFQLEADAEYANDSGNTDMKLTAILSAGVRENIDIVVTSPYHFLSEKGETGERTRGNGISDISLEAKWRFYEKEGLSFAVKPGIFLPTGDFEKGLGDGRPAYSFFFIAQKEKEPFEVLVNLGYTKNRAEFRDILHASLAGVYSVTKKLEVVSNVGIETNPDRGSNTDPAFLLGGVIYEATKDFELDCGIKTGLTKAEPDYTLLAGTTWRF